MKDWMSIVDLIFGLLLSIALSITFVIGLIVIIDLSGCI